MVHCESRSRSEQRAGAPPVAPAEAPTAWRGTVTPHIPSVRTIRSTCSPKDAGPGKPCPEGVHRPVCTTAIDALAARRLLERAPPCQRSSDIPTLTGRGAAARPPPRYTPACADYGCRRPGESQHWP